MKNRGLWEHKPRFLLFSGIRKTVTKRDCCRTFGVNTGAVRHLIRQGRNTVFTKVCIHLGLFSGQFATAFTAENTFRIINLFTFLTFFEYILTKKDSLTKVEPHLG